jgi:hypothetical protein
MISLEDFTGFPEGTPIVKDGLIRRCPICGRNGQRRQRFGGAIRFVHVEAARMFADGLLVEPVDCCTISTVAGAA